MRKHKRKVKRELRKARGHHWYSQGTLLSTLRHLLPLWILALILLPAQESHAQAFETLYTEDTSIDSIPVGSLRAEVDALAFFHDNEYDSNIQKGYSLPGVRITPHLAFNPHRQINIEAGVSMLIFNGANKYPCYAYHDIATWKGNQYQRGAHFLPWVRLQASFKHLDVVLGNIYGGSQHGLSAPLYNAEQNLSTDPEMGVQILTRRPHFQSDTWLNWQSYIYELDSHQEAFTVGESARIIWGKTDEAKSWRCFTPIQLTIQHRGGEQDTTAMGVQTLSNASIGLGIEGTPALRHWDHLTAQTSALLSYQQKGHLWPFDTGMAWHSSVSTRFLKHLTVSADYLYAPRQFASLFGNLFFGTISTKHPGTSYHGIHTLRTVIGYQYTFAKAYTLGTQLEAFSLHAPSHTAEHAETERESLVQPSLSEFSFSFGIYFRMSPSILIKKCKNI